MSMKILPIKLHTNSHSKQLQTSYIDQTDSNTCQSAHKADLNYYPQINFTSTKYIQFAKQMQSLKGVHCPICGVKMLTTKELEMVMGIYADNTEAGRKSKCCGCGIFSFGRIN